MDSITVQGVVRPDGSLEVPPLPAIVSGPVEVTVRAIQPVPPAKENWWEYLQRARRELEQAGHQFRSDEEIDAYLRGLRSGDRIDEIYRQMEQHGTTP
jgi:hypothetical protein